MERAAPCLKQLSSCLLLSCSPAARWYAIRWPDVVGVVVGVAAILSVNLPSFLQTPPPGHPPPYFLLLLLPFIPSPLLPFLSLSIHFYSFHLCRWFGSGFSWDPACSPCILWELVSFAQGEHVLFAVTRSGQNLLLSPLLPPSPPPAHTVGLPLPLFYLIPRPPMSNDNSTFCPRIHFVRCACRRRTCPRSQGNVNAPAHPDHARDSRPRSETVRDQDRHAHAQRQATDIWCGEWTVFWVVFRIFFPQYFLEYWKS